MDTASGIVFDDEHLRRYQDDTIAALLPGALYSEHEEKPAPVVVANSLRSERILVLEPPSATAVYQLFRYFHDALIEKLLMNYWNIHQYISDRFSPDQLRNLEKHADQIRSAARAMVRRMILELFTVDEKGAKMKQILSQLEELYLLKDPPSSSSSSKKSTSAACHERVAIKGGKSNFINVDAIHRNTEKTHKQSLLDESDPFKEKCSGPKKRGRHSSQTKDNRPDRVDQIKSSHILSQKSVPPIVYDPSDEQFYISSSSNGVIGVQNMVDYYQVFLLELDIFNDCIPRPSNHGAFLIWLNKGVRCLTPKEWPMHGMMKSIMNMERLFPLKKKRIEKDGVYRCAYTGQRLRAGEEVWHVRILVNDGERYKQWVIGQKLPPSPPNAPEFMRSVKAYYIKTKVTGLVSLFFTEFLALSPMDIARNARKIVKTPVSTTNNKPVTGPKERSVWTKPSSLSGLPENRAFSVNTLWLLLNRLRVGVDEMGLGDFIWLDGTVVPFNVLMERQIEQFREISTNQDMGSGANALQCILFMTTFGRETNYQVGLEILSDPNASGYLSLIHTSVLDFIDIMFPFHHHRAVSTTTTTTDPIIRQSFSLKLFDVHTTSDDRNTVVPVIACPDSPLLSELFSQSIQRHEYRQSCQYKEDYQEKKARIDYLEFYLTRHPFLFLSLFYMIFEPYCEIKDKSSFLEVQSLLKKMGLFISNKDS